MRNLTLFIFFAVIAHAPAFAQTPPATPAPATQVPGAKPKMIKKTICRRVDNEESTGSRLGSAPKVCKVIEVPDPKGERG